MTINIVSPHASLYLGGMEVVTLQMARYLVKNGVTVRFITRQTDTPTDVYQQLINEQSELLQIVEVPLGSETPIPDSTWPTFYRIACDFGVAAQPYYESLKDANLFVTHLSVDSLFLPHDAKNVLHLHGAPSSPDPLMEAALRIPSKTVAHSTSIKAWWENQFPRVSPIVFQNGIDTTYFNGEPTNDRPIDILYVGRFMEHKGIDDILKAVQPNQKVVIAGNGGYLRTLKQLAEERGLLENVTFYDTPSTETIQRLYRQAKVFACPSRGREGVLTTLLEAGASGCAVVTTSGSGMTDLINETNGVVVKPGDVAALQNSFTQLLGSSQRREALATTLQNKIQQNWSWDSKILELMELYNAAI